MHTRFSTDQERTREQVAVAQERVSDTERRALREIDQERTLRQKAELALADLRTELAAVQARVPDAAVASAEERARQLAERDTLSLQQAQAQQAQTEGQAVQGRLRAELEMAARRAERADAEATATRRLVSPRRRAPEAACRKSSGTRMRPVDGSRGSAPVAMPSRQQRRWA
ncbi:hypothetical protein P3W85_43020 [Cupriavidus basilensis]|uniref:Uncharacterized protein n=1 Tax=Cupriavidus basilensis TaxID=68895 RepID=A0ABT6B457_9BURK|nr:hypothetical protein [Cupriavidus basilensis]MDF3839663.1 hypothetical protein [Cupriavidus basilensis]